ncbi:transporter, cation channel family protein [Cooperia oncophora]
MYNPQVNYFSIIQLTIEIPSEGSTVHVMFRVGDIYYADLAGFLLPDSWIESVRLIRNQGRDGTTVMVFEGCRSGRPDYGGEPKPRAASLTTVLYIGYAIINFIVNTFLTAYQTRPRSCNFIRLFKYMFIVRFWDLLDFLVGILAITSVVAYFIRQVYIDKALASFAATNGNVYINLAMQRNVELVFTYCVGGVVFFVACKMIKILRFNRRISILATTLDYASVPIKDFATVFLVIICAFNAALYCLLWARLESYNSIISTFATSISGMLGKFVVANMFTINPLAFIIFLTFMYTATLFLINIFVMIVLFEFEQVRRQRNFQRMSRVHVYRESKHFECAFHQ